MFETKLSKILNIPFLGIKEDCAHLRRKLERQKKNEMYYNSDEILMEEIKEYKVH